MRTALLLLALCSCYPPAPNLNRDGGVDGGNTAELCAFSGGKSGSVPCTFTSATWLQSTNRTTIQVDSAPGAATAVSAQFSISGTPRAATTYSGGTADTECTIDVTDGPRRWSASTTMALGGCVVAVRTVRELSNVNDMRTYDLHGGFTASTEPDDGDGGTVTVQNSF
ncbi:MAG: hypothetical protein JNK82_32200 [Myxococcaceae bacterium]|nr:hypothetical protein [Myxococcaceae bacterium]